ncbi:hypothetical protein ES703_73029 [subsurface metagenome]
MGINNLLYVDDDPDWLEVGQRRFQEITPNVDTADSYKSGLQMAREKQYDLIVLDGLNRGCFTFWRLIQDENIPHGDIVVFSFDDREYKEFTEELGMSFYSKRDDGLKKIIEKYKK